MQQLLSISNDAKTVKGEKYGYRTHVLYLAPGDLSGNEVCFWRSEECFKACLYLSGRGYMKSVQASRIAKTKRYFADKKQFINDLCEEIHKTSLSANKAGYIPVYRLDGTSDLGLAQKIAPKFKHLQFYDYTKNFKRKPKTNWHITYSFDGGNWQNCRRILSNSKNVGSKIVGPCGNVAIVFKNKLPTHYRGWPVIDGDQNDLRFLDRKNSIVGLKIKGGKKPAINQFFV